jgi:hypothetical protein
MANSGDNLLYNKNDIYSLQLARTSSFTKLAMQMFHLYFVLKFTSVKKQDKRKWSSCTFTSTENNVGQNKLASLPAALFLTMLTN